MPEVELPDAGAITVLLQRSAAADGLASEHLLTLVYDQLRALAARLLNGERAGHTLSPTALVHEMYLRLFGDRTLAPADRRQFFALAARRMRQVLVDHARRRDADKRGGGGMERITLSQLGDAAIADAQGVDAMALEQAMLQLEAADPRKARVVELRYFAGLDMTDVAEVLQVSRATAHRDWEVARSFLFKALQ
jgi:RNA polymerase sigma factor (TIGR02999 family)